MIALLVAALALQPAPDAADVALDLSARCLRVMTGEAEPPAGLPMITLAGGLKARLALGAGGCSLTVEGWRGGSDDFAAKVRDGLLADSDHWRVTRWRERQVNESDPMLWTSLVFPDIRRDGAYRVQIIEPEQGAPGRLSVTFGIDP